MVSSVDAKNTHHPQQETRHSFGKMLDKYPAIHKVYMFAMHLLRGLCMGALAIITPLNPVCSFLICGSAAVLYWAGIERHCIFNFALPAFAGGSVMQLLFSKQMEIIALGMKFTPLWLLGIAYLSNRDVNEYMKRSTLQKDSCCSP